MIENKKEKDDFDKKIQSYRQEKKNRLSRLADFRGEYTVNLFMQDLVKYFEEEVDFDLEKIKEHIKKPDKLKEYIEKAKEKDTHPVAEFIQKLFKELGASGKEKWPEELERGEFLLDD